MKVNHTTKWLLGVSAFACAAAASAAVEISNPSVRAGVSDYGTLGSGNSTSPGVLFDPTASSNYGVNDFLTPGTPFEGFYVFSGGSSIASSNNSSSYGSSFSSLSPSLLSPTSATWTGTSGGLTVVNTYSLATVGGRSAIDITTTLTNNGSGELPSVSFLRALDPDPDVNAFGSFNTINSIVSPDQVCATGSSSGQTICLYTSSAFSHNSGIVSGGSGTWSTNPQDYLSGTNAGNGDNAIGIGFSLGNLAAGQSVTLSYGYAAGATSAIVITPPVVGAVPEPSAYALAALSLGMLGFASRRRSR